MKKLVTLRNEKDRAIAKLGELTRREALASTLKVLGTGFLGLTLKHSEAGELPRERLNHLVGSPHKLLVVDKGSTLELHTNLLPTHPTGFFPNAHCPSPISATNTTFTIPKSPSGPAATIDTPDPAKALDYNFFGVCINGVVIDTSGPWRNGDTSSGYQFDVASLLARIYLGLDFTNCHSQQGGPNSAVNVYHLHGFYIALWDQLERERLRSKQASGMTLLGFAADGLPIYGPYMHRNNDLDEPLVPVRPSYALLPNRPSGGPDTSKFPMGTFVQDYVYRKGYGDLDALNGLPNVRTPQFPNGTYCYFMTHTFPYTARYHALTADKSFIHGPAAAGLTNASAPLPKQLYG